MNWKTLSTTQELDEIKELSHKQPVLIYKHSTRCATSSMALSRLERSWSEQQAPHIVPCFLDLIAHRDISNAVSETFSVPHESPQALLIKNGECVYDASHMGISFQNICKAAGKADEIA